MKFFWSGLVIFVLCAFPRIILAEEQITITTYYPSPYGSYRELETEILHFSESANGLVNFNYPDATYDRRLRITAGKDDTGDNDQGASIDLHGNRHADAGRLDLVAGRGGNITFWGSPAGMAASERMRITSDGSVGIGKANPVAKLHVNNSTQECFIRMTENNEANGFDVGISGTTSTAIVWNSKNTAMRFGTNKIERMRIDASGNVGIGTASPSARLSVAGGDLSAEQNAWGTCRSVTGWAKLQCADGEFLTEVAISQGRSVNDMVGRCCKP